MVRYNNLQLKTNGFTRNGHLQVKVQLINIVSTLIYSVMFYLFQKLGYRLKSQIDLILNLHTLNHFYHPSCILINPQALSSIIMRSYQLLCALINFYGISSTFVNPH